MPAHSSLTAFIAALAVGVLSGTAAAAERQCRVDGIEGEGNRVWSGGEWGELAIGSSVPEEAKIATGHEGRVNLACDDGIIVSVGPGSEVNLEQLAGQSGPGRSAIVQLAAGIIGIIAPYRNWKRFEVRTPLAIASVRSTEWLVEHRADSGTAVFARKGVVDVASGSEVHRLASGDGITITDTGEPPRVKQWSLERIARSGQALGFGWK
jgi:hypothetical protein